MSQLYLEYKHGAERPGEQGFLLVGVIVMAALVLIALSVAAPIVAKDLKRERELEAKHRGEQYVRAIRLYYKKNNSYPTSVKLLEGGQPLERYLRQHYLDPMTGKDDWKLIGLGQAKTTVKGFFGQPLSGLNGAAGGGLGTAGGMQSSGVPNTGGTSGSTGPSGSNTSGSNTSGSPGEPSSSGTSAFGTSSFGQNGANGGGSAFGSGSTGPFVGVGIPKDGPSIITLNEQTDYSTWEFIYDPRIEQLYAKSSIFGGGIASSSGGLGSATDLNSTPGASSPTNPNAPAPGAPAPGGATPAPNPAPITANPTQ
jgi:type II secretory pathway pseudopilin PulG